MKCPNDHGNMKIKKFKEELIFRGIPVRFAADHYACPVCGLAVDDMELAAANQKSIADAYRKAAGLLTSTEIVRGRKKFDWTQERLAEAMRVGIASIKRWETGQIQTKSMDNILRKVLLGDSSGIDCYTGNRVLSLARIKIVVEEFKKYLGKALLKDTGEGILYTGKYLWFADMLAFRETGQSMTGATYAALPQGPQLNNYRDLAKLIALADPRGAEPLTEIEKRIIRKIAVKFPSRQSIYRAVHAEPAWSQRKSGEMISYCEAQSLKSLD
jgi:putative zinc finger/helix-turn-helix YgiT family protein